MREKGNHPLSDGKCNEDEIEIDRNLFGSLFKERRISQKCTDKEQICRNTRTERRQYPKLVIFVLCRGVFVDLVKGVETEKLVSQQQYHPRIEQPRCCKSADTEKQCSGKKKREVGGVDLLIEWRHLGKTWKSG